MISLLFYCYKSEIDIILYETKTFIQIYSFYVDQFCVRRMELYGYAMTEKYAKKVVQIKKLIAKEILMKLSQNEFLASQWNIKHEIIAQNVQKNPKYGMI